MTRIRWTALMTHEGELDAHALAELDLPEEATPREIMRALRSPQGQAILGRLSADGTWVGSGPYMFAGVVSTDAPAHP